MSLSSKYKKRYIAKKQRPLSVQISVVAAVFLLIASGLTYSHISQYLRKTTSVRVKLDKELNLIPLKINGWTGKDLPISLEILKVADNDDYINRIYSYPKENISVNLYIAFSSRPRTMLGHRPRVCYKGAGWIHDETIETSYKTQDRSTVPCLIHKFHKEYDEIYVMNFYILNGKITTSESGFGGIGFKKPNIQGQLARYVAQVQISARYESEIKKAAQEFTDTIMEFFPIIEKQ